MIQTSLILFLVSILCCHLQGKSKPNTKDDEKSSHYLRVSKDPESPAHKSIVYEAENGIVEISADVENTDFCSQCKAEWEKLKKEEKDDSEKKDDKKAKSYSPSSKVSIKWSTRE